MPTAAYIPLANITLANSTTASVTFSSIPATYKDLIVIVQAAGSTANQTINFRFNGDATTVYNNLSMYTQDVGTIGSFKSNAQPYISGNVGVMSATIPSLCYINILDYTATNKHKSLLIRSDSTNSQINANSARWASTSAINSVLIRASTTTGNFLTGSTFALYGIVG